MNKLPIDLQRYIFSFDSTYHEHYQYEIMPYLENLWTIKYIYKHNNERGVDLSHLFSGPFATEDWNNGYWIENGVDLDYSHKKAKKICDYLIVSITSSQFIKKGPNRPINNNNQRLFFLQNLKLIDHVFVASGENGVDSINLIRPDFYFKGNDYKDNSSDRTKKIFYEIDAVKKNRGKIIYTNEKQMSSSKIVNQLGINLNKTKKKFLKQVKKKDNFESIIKALNKLKKNKVLIVGDLIIDRYIYGNVLGKSGKEPHMVFGQTKEDFYIGGSAIIANHLSDFINKITLISDFGSEIKIKKLLKDNFKKNIKHLEILPKKEYKTCIKTRFVDILTKYKLFGSYIISNLQFPMFYVAAADRDEHHPPNILPTQQEPFASRSREKDTFPRNVSNFLDTIRRTPTHPG
mgnify:CR=1 FL=1